MKILILHKNNIWGGGVVNFVRMLAMPPNQEYFESFIIGPRNVNEARFLSFLRPLVDAVRLLSSLKTRQFDIVFINPSLDVRSFLRDALLIVVAKRLCKKPLFVFMHGWEHAFYKKIEASWFLKALYRSSFQHADHTVVLASTFKSDLVTLGADASRVSTLPTMYLKQEVPESAVDRWRDDGKLEFLFLSRLVKEKGLFESIRAFSRLREDYPGIRLHIAGDGPAESEAKALAKKLQLGEAVIFHGYVKADEKRELLTRASVFVFPTYYGEGCPVSLLEAMAAGLPVITADAGGIKDVFTEQCGVLLPVVTDEAVYHAMRNMVASAEKLNVISRHNAEYASDNFERENISSRIIDLCKSILN